MIKKLFSTYFKWLLLTGVVLTSVVGCKPTRLLTNDEYLLRKNKIIIENKSNVIDKKQLEPYYRQRPNKYAFMFFPFKLMVFNFSQLGKERKWKNWMGRVIGEEPVIYNSSLVDKTKQQFSRYLKNEAFYKAEVESNVQFKGQKAKVTYLITPNEPIFIDDVFYNVEDTTISDIIYADTINSQVQPGKYFSITYLKKERQRIVNQVKDSGYYEFNEEYVTYTVDTSGYKANIQVDVNMALQRDDEEELIQVPHRKYWIRDVYFYPDYDPQKAIRDRFRYYKTFDTIMHRNYHFVYPGKVNVKPKVILKAGAMSPGQMYKLTDATDTRRYLNSLRLFRLNNISFSDVQQSDSLIDCHVQLSPFTYQSFSVNFETTNTRGNLGLGGFVNYEHRNLFRGAEIFNIKLSGSYQFRSGDENLPNADIIEMGAQTSLDIPSFILPFKMERFYKKYNPKTSFRAAFNYQQQPEYTRVIYSASMGYYWRVGDNIRHIVNPIDLSSVKIPFRSAEHEEKYRDTYVEKSFQNYFIAGERYSLIYQSQTQYKKTNRTFFRWNIDFAGNLLNLLHHTFDADTVEGGHFEVFGLQFAQYAKTDFDIRYYQQITPRNMMVYRTFAGVVFPYGNAGAVPFVKQYYSGGAQGIRAWQPQALGPGSYHMPDTVYPDQYGDIKLELNAEYRFDITNTWKGAVFVDVGNIWAISKADERQGALFEFSNFYNDLAVGTGIGIRADFNFAVIRVDGGIKVRDPSIQGNDSWVLFNKKPALNDILWNFAIGYPF